MSLQLTRVDDPRDALERARRPELVRFARENGITDITEQMPAILIRRILRDRHITRINVPKRTLGAPPAPRSPGHYDPSTPLPSVLAEEPGHEVDFEADLARQFAQTRDKPVQQMGYNELRAEAVRRGIKLSRSDNLAVIKGKLGVVNPP